MDQNERLRVLPGIVAGRISQGGRAFRAKARAWLATRGVGAPAQPVTGLTVSADPILTEIAASIERFAAGVLDQLAQRREEPGGGQLAAEVTVAARLGRALASRCLAVLSDSATGADLRRYLMDTLGEHYPPSYRMQLERVREQLVQARDSLADLAAGLAELHASLLTAPLAGSVAADQRRALEDVRHRLERMRTYETALQSAYESLHFGRARA